jgi:hypothetical protein
MYIIADKAAAAAAAHIFDIKIKLIWAYMEHLSKQFIDGYLEKQSAELAHSNSFP